MAAVHGSKGSVLLDEFDVSQYFTQASVVKQAQTVNVTTFGNDDKLYIVGQGSGSLSLNGVWDGAAGAVDSTLDAALGSDTVITVGIGGSATLGGPAILLQALNTGYQIRPTVNDAVRITANATANGGVRIAGVFLQPLEAETTTFNGSSVNNLASSAFGGVAHLHVTAFDGTDATVKVQDSADNDMWADLVTFTEITDVGSQRILVEGVVDQYLRFAVTVDNFTSMVIACSFARNRRA
jgi:hypothetical protein